MPPMMTADTLFTNAHGAVIATRPASMPLASMLGSGLPNLVQTYSIAVKAPAAPASMVFTAMTAMRRSPPASVEPALKPNQPNARMKVPATAIGMLWPGIALGVPSFVNLPIRGPSTIAPASAATPPTMCTTPEPAKSTWPLPSPKLPPAPTASRRPRPSWRRAGR